MASRRALFLDLGGTLARLRDNRTVVDADGHPVLMPNVAETLARVRPDFDRCFIVSNQGRIARGEITAEEVFRRFTWVNEHLGGPFADWRIYPHVDADGCRCRKPLPVCASDAGVRHEGGAATGTTSRGRLTRTVVPTSGSLAMCSAPPWAATRCLTMASPSPVPPSSRERALSTR